MTTVNELENTRKCQLPDHLNEKYLKQVLEKILSKRIEHIEYNYELSSSNGENFNSNIYRIKLLYSCDNNKKLHEIRWIVKDMHMDIVELGTNEAVMYEKILPAFEEILKPMGSNSIRLRPRCFECIHEREYEFYILEDLNELGYQSGNRYEGLNEPQTKVVLEKIAKFHAASMIYASMHPEVIANLSPSHFANGASDPIACSITHGGMQYASNLLESLGEFDETVKKMRRLAEKFDEKIKEIIKAENSAFNVLNHGDLWVNNMLFKKTGSETKDEYDVVFVDFQDGVWCSPAKDVLYFLFTSVPLEILQRQRYEFLRYYYSTLKSTLQQCGNKVELKIPTWSMFQQEIRRCALIGYHAAVCELPICCMSSEVSKGFNAETFSNVEEMEKRRQLLHTNKRAMETLVYAVQYFEEIGLLDEF